VHRVDLVATRAGVARRAQVRVEPAGTAQQLVIFGAESIGLMGIPLGQAEVVGDMFLIESNAA